MSRPLKILLLASEDEPIASSGELGRAVGGLAKALKSLGVDARIVMPKYKGLHTHARALAAGDTLHGCTVHEVTPVLDDGPILGQATVPVLPGDTKESLAARVVEQEHRLYPQVLRRYVAGNLEPLYLDTP